MPTPKPPSDSRPTSSPPFRIRPLRWLKSLLKGKLRLERRGINVHLRLDPAPLEETVMPPPSHGQALREAHATLRKLLDRHPDARRTLRHLVYVEEMIARTGSRALKKVPAPVLRKAQGQLALLTREMPHGALEVLNERLAAALRGRGHEAVANTRPQELQVMETSHSVFDAEEQRWTDRMPLDAPAAGPPRR